MRTRCPSAASASTSMAAKSPWERSVSTQLASRNTASDRDAAGADESADGLRGSGDAGPSTTNTMGCPALSWMPDFNSPLLTPRTSSRPSPWEALMDCSLPSWAPYPRAMPAARRVAAEEESRAAPRACLVHAQGSIVEGAGGAGVTSEPARCGCGPGLADAIDVAAPAARRRSAGRARIEASRANRWGRARIGPVQPRHVTPDPARAVPHVGDSADSHGEHGRLVDRLRWREIHGELRRWIIHEARRAQARHPRGNDVHCPAGVHVIRVVTAGAGGHAVLEKEAGARRAASQQFAANQHFQSVHEIVPPDVCRRSVHCRQRGYEAQP